MTTTTKNTNLNATKANRNDEFFTTLSDIEAELTHYPNAFRGKTVYLNADNPEYSQFWAYFSDEENFERLGIAELVATHYTPGAKTSTATAKTTDGIRTQTLEGDGDFRGPACTKLLKQADVVVTNPPFSCFRQFIAQLVEYDKEFLILGNLSATTYNQVWPLLREGKIWLGGAPSFTAFRVPQDSPPRKHRFWVDDEGQKWRSLGNACWFTNLDHARRHKPLPLTEEYDPAKYPRYDNYDGIEVSRVANIPKDFDGVMGVPITFLTKHNPEQFEIVGFRKGDDGKDLKHSGGVYPFNRFLITPSKSPETNTTDE